MRSKFPEEVVIGDMISWKVAIVMVENARLTVVGRFDCLLLLEMVGELRARGVKGEGDTEAMLEIKSNPWVSWREIGFLESWRYWLFLVTNHKLYWLLAKLQMGVVCTHEDWN